MTSRSRDSRQTQTFTEPPITTCDAACYWDHSDICAFLICVVMLGALVRLAVALHLLPPFALQQPTLLLQAVVLACVLLALYATLKWRHGGQVWRALGWNLPPRRYLVVASLGGVMLAAA